jgi:hypothetical protein
MCVCVRERDGEIGREFACERVAVATPPIYTHPCSTAPAYLGDMSECVQYLQG